MFPELSCALERTWDLGDDFVIREDEHGLERVVVRERIMAAVEDGDLRGLVIPEYARNGGDDGRGVEVLERLVRCAGRCRSGRCGRCVECRGAETDRQRGERRGLAGVDGL